jgi:hypothetical protein
MPDYAPLPANAWSGWKVEVDATVTDPSLLTAVLKDAPVSKSIDAALKISLTPPALSHAGEGSAWQASKVAIDAPAGLTDNAGRQWLRVKAVGTASVPGWRGPSKNKLDNQLRGIAFMHDWHGGAFTLIDSPTATPRQVKAFNQTIAQPQVSRWLEVIVQPVSPYNAALGCPGAIKITNSSALVDSFDSSDPTKSHSGIYDSTVRQSNGGVFTNGASLILAGDVYGNVGAVGGSAPTGVNIHGSFGSDSLRTYLPVPYDTSNWIAVTDLVAGLRGRAKKIIRGADVSLTLALDEAGRYSLPGLSGKLTLDGPVGSSVEILVDGAFTGSVEVKAGVRAIVYFKGDLNVAASALACDSQRAGDLQLIGIQPADGDNRAVTIALDAPLYASIYAPGHAFTFTGDGDFMGALVAKSFTATGRVNLHYDEALARLPKPIADYKVASWVEEVR